LAKDGPQGEEIISKLEVVDVGLDEDGERITSCVIVQVQGSSTGNAQLASLTAGERGWLKDLTTIFAEPGLAEMGSPASGFPIMPILTRNLTRDRLKSKGRFTLDPDGNLTGADRTKLNTALNNLRLKGKIGMTDKYVWLIKERQ